MQWSTSDAVVVVIAIECICRQYLFTRVLLVGPHGTRRFYTVVVFSAELFVLTGDWVAAEMWHSLSNKYLLMTCYYFTRLRAKSCIGLNALPI